MIFHLDIAITSELKII